MGSDALMIAKELEGIKNALIHSNEGMTAQEANHILKISNIQIIKWTKWLALSTVLLAFATFMLVLLTAKSLKVI